MMLDLDQQRRKNGLEGGDDAAPGFIASGAMVCAGTLPGNPHQARRQVVP